MLQKLIALIKKSTSCDKHAWELDKIYMSKQHISGVGGGAVNAFLPSKALAYTTAACHSCPHVGGSCMLCSADCSNTSCSITEVLDLTPPPPNLMTGCVCVWGQAAHMKCVCARVYVRVQYTRGWMKSQRARVCFPWHGLRLNSYSLHPDIRLSFSS